MCGLLQTFQSLIDYDTEHKQKEEFYRKEYDRKHYIYDCKFVNQKFRYLLGRQKDFSSSMSYTKYASGHKEIHDLQLWFSRDFYKQIESCKIMPKDRGVKKFMKETQLIEKTEELTIRTD